MTVSARLAAFAVGLAAAFGVGIALGASVGPEPAPLPAHAPDATDAPHSPSEHGFG